MAIRRGGQGAVVRSCSATIHRPGLARCTRRDAAPSERQYARITAADVGADLIIATFGIRRALAVTRWGRAEMAGGHRGTEGRAVGPGEASARPGRATPTEGELLPADIVAGAAGLGCAGADLPVEALGGRDTRVLGQATPGAIADTIACRATAKVAGGGAEAVAIGTEGPGRATGGDALPAVANRPARTGTARAATAIIAAPLPRAATHAGCQGRWRRGLLSFVLPFPSVLLTLVRSDPGHAEHVIQTGND
jgi:hypothetical protein